MARVSKEALQPGMRLAKPLLSPNGMVFLPEGAELTDPLIARIQEMEVTAIFVEGSAEPAVPREEALAALARRFETVREKPHMGLIERVVRRHVESLYT